jgi:hypothetical protein
MGIAHRNDKLALGEANDNLLHQIKGKTLFWSKLGFRGIMLFAVLLLWLSPVYASGTITETFIGNQYNTDLWSLWNMGAGTTAQVANNRLEVTVGGNGYAGLNGWGFTLIGDFEMKVDFTLINWPLANGTQLAIGTFDASYQSQVQVARANTRTPTITDVEQYFAIIMGDNHATNVTGQTDGGTLRLVRTGNKMEGFYLDGSEWKSILAVTNTDLGQRVGVTMGIGPYGNNYSGITAIAAFSNIRIDYATLGPSFGQGNPCPGLMLLLDN